ncbi:MAG: D-erythronate dehydrogenase [Saprospiraceae bacterium]
MKIIITGGAGFLGQRLAKMLLKAELQIEELILVDIVLPGNFFNDPRVKCFQTDLSDQPAVEKLITPNTDIVFHLAAVVSSHAEKDFDLGYRVNLDMTRWLLEACKHKNEKIKFVFSSSCAVYGGNLPTVIQDETGLTPLSSYGTQKAMAELMINDYSRKGYVDGRSLRLPTICVRPGKANLAASSFVSSIIREPLNGLSAICPVSTELPIWISSPGTVIKNIIKSAFITSEKFDGWRSVCLPGISIKIKDMISTLENIAGKETTTRIQYIHDENINRLVITWPGDIDNSRALAMGFDVDENFDDFITQYIAENIE